MYAHIRFETQVLPIQGELKGVFSVLYFLISPPKLGSLILPLSLGGVRRSREGVCRGLRGGSAEGVCPMTTSSANAPIADLLYAETNLGQ